MQVLEKLIIVAGILLLTSSAVAGKNSAKACKPIARKFNEIKNNIMSSKGISYGGGVVCEDQEAHFGYSAGPCITKYGARSSIRAKGERISAMDTICEHAGDCVKNCRGYVSIARKKVRELYTYLVPKSFSDASRADSCKPGLLGSYMLSDPCRHVNELLRNISRSSKPGSRKNTSTTSGENLR